MRSDEYQNMFQHEENYWWYRSHREAVLNIIGELLSKNKSLSFLLDGGCGTGGMLKILSDKLPSLHLIGLDTAQEALLYCKERGIHRLIQGSLVNLPFADSTFDLVISLDVLYHKSIDDDVLPCREIHRVLKPGGYVILHLPALEFLRGSHDIVVYSKRRYSRIALCNKMQELGFKVERCTYRYIFLFPVLFLWRTVNRWFMKGVKKSDLRDVPLWLSNILFSISHCENKMLKYFDLPFGSSLFCICKKL